MALLRCAGADLIQGRLHMPERGAWWAELVLDLATAPAVGSQVTLASDEGFSIAGAITQSGVFLDAAHVRLVGGAGGLSKLVPAASYENALLRDPLNAVMSASGETASETIADSITNTLLAAWTIVQQRAGAVLNLLCGAVGTGTVWRVLENGKVWLGQETWPSQGMPSGSDLLEEHPAEQRFVIGCEAPFLVPGVALAGVGNVQAVDHWFEAESVRSWAWV